MIEETLAKLVTELPGPKSKELLEKRKKYVPRGVSNAVEVFADEARGSLIKDIDGNVFLDFVAGIGVQNVGHCDDSVVEAIKEQSEKYIHPCFHVFMYEPYVELAEKLSGLTPGSFEKKAMFANSGAEAVENAIKIARAYTGKTGVITLDGAFHGRTYMTMTLTSKYKPYKYGFGACAPDTYKIPNPYCYRCPMGCSYPGCQLECVKRFKQKLETEFPINNIACLIAEPLQGEGGFIVPPTEYFKAIKEICDEHGIIFIIDEIQAGFARTGKFFATEYYGVEPDIITMSKSIAAGIPLSAVVGKAEIMDAPIPGGIGGTYGGSPVGCAAALKVIEKIKNDKLEEKACTLGKLLTDRLNRMKEKYAVIGDVRGLGSMIGIEFVKDRETKEPYAELIKPIINECYKNGVLIMNAGVLSNVIRLLPPLVMTEEQANFGMDVLEKAIEKVLAK